MTWADIEDVLSEARRRNFLGRLPLSAHVDNAAVFAQALERFGATKIVDLGSGGGVPALIIAASHRDWDWLLVERGERRAEWLVEAAEQLALQDRIAVVCRNAEDAARVDAHQGWADAVTARSFAPPSVTAECATRFLRMGGHLVVSEPPESGQDHLNRWDSPILTELGLEMGERLTEGETTVQILVRVGEVQPRYPRRPSTTRKRPLF